MEVSRRNLGAALTKGQHGYPLGGPLYSPAEESLEPETNCQSHSPYWLLGGCLSFFAIAVIQRHDEVNLRKKE